jgi:hypothetical protein
LSAHPAPPAQGVIAEGGRHGCCGDPPVAHPTLEQHLKATHLPKVAFWTQVARVGDTDSANDPSDSWPGSTTGRIAWNGCGFQRYGELEIAEGAPPVSATAWGPDLAVAMTKDNALR